MSLTEAGPTWRSRGEKVGFPGKKVGDVVSRPPPSSLVGQTEGFAEEDLAGTLQGGGGIDLRGEMVGLAESLEDSAGAGGETNSFPMRKSVLCPNRALLCSDGAEFLDSVDTSR